MTEPDGAGAEVTGAEVTGAEGTGAEVLDAKIRALRRSHGMTLEALAEAAGLSIGFLGLAERGRKKPSFASLQKISAAHGVEIGWFLPPQPSEDPAERAYVVRKGYRRRITYTRLSGSDCFGEADHLLSPSIDGQLALTMMTFAPGSHSGDDPMRHEGEEAGYVLAGRLTPEIDGARLAPDPGDSFGFPGDRPHRYVNEGAEELRILLANTPVIVTRR